MINTAVVVGGSISGLLAAHSLAPYCRKVCIVDKDDLTSPPRAHLVPDKASMAWRKGVPQICQPHQLTAGGAKALDTLLPGFHDEMISLGAIDLDLALHVHYFDYEGTYPKFKSHLRGLGVSRPLLEQSLRDRVYHEHGLSKKLTVLNDTMVDFEADDEGIRGVHLRQYGELPCEIYVDASGRSSILPALLRKHGMGQPEKVTVDAKIKSASRLIKVPDTFKDEWKLLVIKSLPSGTKGGSLLPMEGNIWQVTLADAGGEQLCLTDEGFLRFAAQLPDKTLYHILLQAIPLTDVVEYKAMRNEKLLFNKVKLPPGLLPIGDSVQRLNPIYGQVRIRINRYD
jgi:2-polyprenyl-6-methoxyphenol hydroxylase-like FAD-dependent oxidoreductase